MSDHGYASRRRSLRSGESSHGCACPKPAKPTQPWVFFNLPAPDFPSARRRRAEREARDAEAAASGHGGVPKQSMHAGPPSLEQAIASLKIEHGAK